LLNFSSFIKERSNLAAEKLAALRNKSTSTVKKTPEHRQITKPELDQLEKHLDALFKHLKIDIEFTRHFFDRLNNERNKKDITISELNDLFQKVHKKFGVKLTHEPDKFEAVFKSISSKINIPFVVKLNNGMIEIISKTVMRKDSFKTSNQQLKV